MSDEDVTKRAESDPEVMAILADPVMRTILQQMQSDPRAIVEYVLIAPLGRQRTCAFWGICSPLRPRRQLVVGARWSTPGT